MRVALDDRAAGDVRGIGRYVRCLRAALAEAAVPGDELVAAAGCGPFVDVYHAPWIDGAQLRPRCPQVVTVHDLAPLKRRREYLRTGVRFRLRYLAVQHSAAVIVPTQAVAEDAARLLGLADDQLHVVPEAADPVFAPASAERVAEVRARLGLPERFLLWVGGLRHPDPRKRVAELVATPRDLPLVLAGPTGAWADELRGVQLTGELSDEDLRAVYTAAHALVLPSDEEGFGLTPVEALACGCPVACSDTPAVRDALGDRAAFVAADDLPGLVRAAQDLRRPAPASPEWTWESAALVTWGVYREVAARVGHPAPRGVRRPARRPAR